ncbi:MAG: hypothetical protein KDA78_21330, partial [Planctomycetaceae bacterium]|nr:hypothetical protein [Planctomycetaceae bacterium]
LDFRENATRQLSNFSLTVPGRACLLNGALAVRGWISRVIASLGGVLTDEWLRRLDVCVDLPGIQASTLLELCEKRQFIASSRAIQFRYDGEAATSFTLGNRKSVQMQIYDKLQEVRYKNDPEYHAAMQIFRWKEMAPQGATRVEIRIYRDWFAKWQNTEVDNVIKCLGSVLHQLLVDTTRPLFRLLAQTPDRKNNHQSKCDIHPLWELIREKMIREAGNEPLMLQRKLRKGDIDVSRAAKMAAAFVITAAVQRGIGIDCLDDLIEEFRQLAYLNLSNDIVAAQYQKKAVVAGVSNPGVEFDFGANVASI